MFPLFPFRILIFLIPQTQDVIRRAVCSVKRKDSRMVNMSEGSEKLRSNGDFLSLTKTGRGRNVLRHGHIFGKEKG